MLDRPHMWFSIVLTTTDAINCGNSKSNGLSYVLNYSDCLLFAFYVYSEYLLCSIIKMVLEFFKILNSF